MIVRKIVGITLMGACAALPLGTLAGASEGSGVLVTLAGNGGVEEFKDALALADTTLLHASHLAGYFRNTILTQAAYTDPNLDGWPSHNAGWPNLTTTRASGSSTNDTGAMEIRGWRWDVSDNDYEVHRNWSYDRKYPINDGEGLMHEDHCNSSIRDSVMRGNRGNAYLSLYKTAGIDGLLIEDNDIRPPGGASSIAPIFVSANRTKEKFPVRKVTIRGNTTNGAILIEGEPGENNRVEGNRFVGQGEGVIHNRANATVRDNRGFKVANQPG